MAPDTLPVRCLQIAIRHTAGKAETGAEQVQMNRPAARPAQPENP